MVDASITGCILTTRHMTRACGHQRPRSTEGILASRISRVRNAITPMASGRLLAASRSTVREKECASGSRMVQEAKASSRKAAGNHNRLDRACAQPERVLTWTR
jgi:hypothetical protein